MNRFFPAIALAIALAGCNPDQGDSPLRSNRERPEGPVQKTAFSSILSHPFWEKGKVTEEVVENILFEIRTRPDGIVVVDQTGKFLWLGMANSGFGTADGRPIQAGLLAVHGLADAWSLQVTSLSKDRVYTPVAFGASREQAFYYLRAALDGKTYRQLLSENDLLIQDLLGVTPPKK